MQSVHRCEVEHRTLPIDTTYPPPAHPTCAASNCSTRARTHTHAHAHARTHAPTDGQTDACTQARTHARTHGSTPHARMLERARTHTNMSIDKDPLTDRAQTHSLDGHPRTRWLGVFKSSSDTCLRYAIACCVLRVECCMQLLCSGRTRADDCLSRAGAMRHGTALPSGQLSWDTNRLLSPNLLDALLQPSGRNVRVCVHAIARVHKRT